MLDKLARTVADCRRCVVLTGAGISAESGVPTFRGKEGLWGKFKPEELATMDAFVANPDIVWEWYSWRRELLDSIRPNAAHYALTQIEQLFDQFQLITQNVDGLHQAAGSKEVLEMHGNIRHNKCVDCNCPFEGKPNINPNRIPACQTCGGKIRPDVVWFGELLDPATIDRAFELSEKADLFFSIGTSSLVQPAAALPVAAARHGATLVEINPEHTPISEIADFYFPAPAGEFLPELMQRIDIVRTDT